MLRATINRALFAHETNLRGWVLTIMRNLRISQIRHRKYEVEEDEDVLDEHCSTDPDHDLQLQLRELAWAWRSLPATQRTALELVYIDGVSQQQAAHTCGVAIGTVKSRIARGREQLTHLLICDHTKRVPAPSFRRTPAQARGDEPGQTCWLFEGALAIHDSSRDVASATQAAPVVRRRRTPRRAKIRLNAAATGHWSTSDVSSATADERGG